MGGVADQHDPVAVPDHGRVGHDDVPVADAEDPDVGHALDQVAEVAGERAGAIEPGARARGDRPLDRPTRLGPEDRRLVEPRREDPEGDPRVAVALGEDVAGETVRIRHDRPDGAVGIARILDREAETSADDGADAVCGDDEVPRTVAA